MNRFIIIILICVGGTNVYGQDDTRFSIAAMTESMAFPFTRYTPIHPGLDLGYTLKEVDRSGLIKSTNVHLGWYYHKRVENALYLRVDWAWQFKVLEILTADLFSGIGYMHVFYPGEVYELNSSSGEFEKIMQNGRSHALGNIGIGVTFRNSSRYEPFIRQDLMIQTPFANGIPVMIHSFLKLGTYIKIK